MKRTPVSAAPIDYEKLAQEIAPRVAALVFAKLAIAIGGAGEPYSTRRGHGPPGVSEERWRTLAPTIPGAHKPGRWWLVPRPSYEAWASTSTPAPAPTAANDGPEWDPASVLAELGLRRSR